MDIMQPQVIYNQQDSQEMPYQSKYDVPFGNYPSINPPLKETTIISQTNPKYNIEELKHILRGEEEVIDEDGRSTWVKREGSRPLLNEIGIRSVLADLFAANQGVVFSNFEEENLLAIVRNKGYILVKKLGENMDLFEINQSDLDTILYSILDCIYAAYRRGMNQGERVFVKTFYTENNTQVTRPIEAPPQRKKFLGIF